MRGILANRSKKRIRVVIALAVLMLLAIAFPVLAQTYYAIITITETGGNSYEMVGLRASANVTYMVAANFITPSGLDTRVEVGATEFPHMLGGDRIMFAMATDNFTSEQVWLTMGNVALPAFYIIPGYGGSIVVNDEAAIELDDLFEIQVSGWVDTYAGASKDIILKTDAFRLYVNAAGSIRATVDPLGGNISVTATGISSGEHDIVVHADAVYLRFFIDGVEEDSAMLGGTSVPDNGNNYTLMDNDVMPYAEYIRWYIR